MNPITKTIRIDLANPGGFFQCRGSGRQPERSLRQRRARRIRRTNKKAAAAITEGGEKT